MQELTSVLQGFSTLNLTQIGGAALMKRKDTKFVLSVQLLPGLLQQVQSHYALLEVEGQSIQNYRTRYLDTHDWRFYLHHHNQRINRIKIRYRSYLDSDLTFLEVKRKDQKGQTNKSRKAVAAIEASFSSEQDDFITMETDVNSNHLAPTLDSTFQRITLAAPHRQERATIDINLNYRDLHRPELQQLAIVEVKQGNARQGSPLFQALKATGHRPLRISKYCTGIALLHPELKQNRFKSVFLQLNRILHGSLVQPAA